MMMMIIIVIIIVIIIILIILIILIIILIIIISAFFLFVLHSFFFCVFFCFSLSLSLSLCLSILSILYSLFLSFSLSLSLSLSLACFSKPAWYLIQLWWFYGPGIWPVRQNYFKYAHPPPPLNLPYGQKKGKGGEYKISPWIWNFHTRPLERFPMGTLEFAKWASVLFDNGFHREKVGVNPLQSLFWSCNLAVHASRTWGVICTLWHEENENNSLRVICRNFWGILCSLDVQERKTFSKNYLWDSYLFRNNYFRITFRKY